MESPVVLDKPPEYLGNERGFPFDEEEGTGAWSELAARHPDIAARLRQRPATWARKRRPSSQDGIDDTADSFGGFDRFPFDDIPPEFREHFPSHWNRRFGSREDQFQQPPSPQPQSPQQQTAATQTEHDAGPPHDEQAPLPQYGLRNTVDLGQKSPADPSFVDADDRSQRSMSAPPDQRTVNPNCNKMSGQNHQEQQHPQQQPEQHSNVRHIPIFVEGRDEPVINKSVDHGTHFADAKPTYVPPPQPHVEREQYFADDGPVGFSFAKNFDRPFFRQSPQTFTKQKMYPQTFTRGGSPQRSQSPKPPSYNEHNVPRPETPSKPQQKQPPQQQKQTPPQQKQTPPQQKQSPPQQKQPSPQRASSHPKSPPPPHHDQVPPQQNPPRQQSPPSNDPVKQILTIQADVLNLMTEVENFKGTKKDKYYLYLDEMLTRNLIKLDNIDTDGKENIRQERKEVIKCIQKCIAVLEAKAENRALTTPPPQDVEMQNTDNENSIEEQVVQNGDIEMKETTKESEQKESKVEPIQLQENMNSEPQEQSETEKQEQKPEEPKKEEQLVENKEASIPQVSDQTIADETKSINPSSDPVPELQVAQENVEKKQSPKKGGKKRDKSKDKKDIANNSIKEEVADKKEEPKDGNTEADNKNHVDKIEVTENVNNEENENKKEIVDNKDETMEVMQMDAKGDSNKPDSQTMDVDSTASQ